MSRLVLCIFFLIAGESTLACLSKLAGDVREVKVFGEGNHSSPKVKKKKAKHIAKAAAGETILGLEGFAREEDVVSAARERGLIEDVAEGAVLRGLEQPDFHALTGVLKGIKQYSTVAGLEEEGFVELNKKIIEKLVVPLLNHYPQAREAWVAMRKAERSRKDFPVYQRIDQRVQKLQESGAPIDPADILKARNFRHEIAVPYELRDWVRVFAGQLESRPELKGSLPPSLSRVAFDSTRLIGATFDADKLIVDWRSQLFLESVDQILSELPQADSRKLVLFVGAAHVEDVAAGLKARGHSVTTKILE